MNDLLKFFKDILGIFLPRVPRKELPRLAIYFTITAFVAFKLGNSSTITSQSKQTTQQEQKQESATNIQIGDNKKGEVDEMKAPILLKLDENQKDWDMRTFVKEKDGFYCPRESNNYRYYYAWLSKHVPLIGNYFFKVYTRSSSGVLDDKPGELILKTGKKPDTEYFELLFPARNKQTLQYKQLTEGELKFIEPGGQITTLTKSGTPIEIIQSVTVAEGNRIKTDFYMTYVSRTSSSARLCDPASFPPFSVDETSPSEILTNLAIGVDRKSCLKIENYGVSLSDVEISWLRDN